MSLIINIDELTSSPVVRAHDLQNQDPASLDTRLVYGRSMAFRYATRHPGYHSRPHVHDCEQLNYVTSGTLSIFMNGYEYRLGRGDFMNVPANAVHWAWNRGSDPCVMIETHCPPHYGPDAYALLDRSESATAIQNMETVWLSDKYARGEAELPPAPEDDVWIGRAGRVKPSVHRQMADAGSLTSLYVYGETTNLMVATRASGYHSTPHVHACEQMNFLVSGKLWIFVDQRAFLLRAGDIFRVPASAAHWAWNDSSDECVLIEAHAPVLDPGAKDHALGLLPPERASAVKTVANLFVREEVAGDEAKMQAHASRE